MHVSVLSIIHYKLHILPLIFNDQKGYLFACKYVRHEDGPEALELELDLEVKKVEGFEGGGRERGRVKGEGRARKLGRM